MVDARNIQIGDWINLLKNKSNISGFEVVDACPRKVTSISTDGDAPYIQTNDCDVFYEEGAYQYISLTEEILKKNFPKPYDIRWYPEDNSKTTFVICWEESIGFGYNLTLCIQYVHELQHILKLCNINKEIVL